MGVRRIQEQRTLLCFALLCFASLCFTLLTLLTRLLHFTLLYFTLHYFTVLYFTLLTYLLTHSLTYLLTYFNLPYFALLTYLLIYLLTYLLTYLMYNMYHPYFSSCCVFVEACWQEMSGGYLQVTRSWVIIYYNYKQQSQNSCGLCILEPLFGAS